MHRIPHSLQELNSPTIQGVKRHAKHLVEIKAFGSNDGNLRCYVYIPAKPPPDPPLVVVLHGCTQSAQGYDAASGWSQLADKLGFVVLYPEQRRSNNFGLCFNWFEPGDTVRDSGEVLSIRQMIAAVQTSNAIDPKRIFITGFSGGGAMTSAMLATYPEVFCGGAIIAGMPYGVANGTIDAFAKMQGRRLPEASALATKIAQASNHGGPWPVISIWHGTADHTVKIANAEAIAQQWRAIHNLEEHPSHTELVGAVPHRTWRDPTGRTLIEDYLVPAMGHGTPLNLSDSAPYGSAAPYALDVGISAPARIAEFWGLVRTPSTRTTPKPGCEELNPAKTEKTSEWPKGRSLIARLIVGVFQAAEAP